MEQENPYLAPQVALTEPIAARSLLAPSSDQRTVVGGLGYLVAAWYCLIFALLIWGGTWVVFTLKDATAAQAKTLSQKPLVPRTSVRDDIAFGITVLIVLGVFYFSSPLLQLLGFVRLCRAPRELKIRGLALGSGLMFFGSLVLGAASAILQVLKITPSLVPVTAILGAICGVIFLVTLTLLLDRLAKTLQYPLAKLLSSSLWRLTLVGLVCAGAFLLLAPLAGAWQKAPADGSQAWLIRCTMFSLIASGALLVYSAVLYLLTVFSLRRFMLSQLAAQEPAAEPRLVAATPLPQASAVFPAGASVIADGLLQLLGGVRITVAGALVAFLIVLLEDKVPLKDLILYLLPKALVLLLLFQQYRACSFFRNTPPEIQATQLFPVMYWALIAWSVLHVLAFIAWRFQFQAVMYIELLSILGGAIYQTALVFYLRRVTMNVGDATASALTAWLCIVNVVWLLCGGVLAFFATQLDLPTVAKGVNSLQLPLLPVLVGILWLVISAALFVVYVETVRGLRALVLSKLVSPV